MSNPAPERLAKQIGFILEIDRLKTILRRTYILHADRRENSAEHSWHLAILAVVLAEYSNEPVDVGRVVKMAVIHDIVEVDAGDTFIYDDAGNARKAAAEQRAADRIFGLLPSDQAGEFRAIWDEFEAGVTPESRLARAIDRLMPLLHNFHTSGRAWRENGITADRVLDRNKTIADGSRVLWEFARGLINEAVESGFLKKP